MHLEYHSKFKKQYKKLKPAQRQRLEMALALFQADPYHLDLYNHPLTGEWKGYRSISFGGDWRAHYELVGNDTAYFVAVGRHRQLYRK